MAESFDARGLMFLQDGGEMGALMRATDWAATPLGSPESWSPSLKVVVALLLANRFPQLLWWGPDYISIYNDAYRPVLGAKHPAALGRPFRDVWPEVQHVLAPLIDAPFHGGPSSWTDDIQLEVQRHGFAEETHFTFAYSPVPDDTAPRRIGGVLATVSEITEKIVGERRLAALRDLGTRASEARSAEAACANMAEALAAHPMDVPFALIYLTDDDFQRAHLAGAAGAIVGDPAAPDIVDLRAMDAPWPLGQSAKTLAPVLVERLGARFSSLPAGAWADPPHTALIAPLVAANKLVGFLVAGASSRLRLDEQYRSFFLLIAAQIATAIGNARAYEQERDRAEALAAIDRAKTAFFSNISHEFRTPLALMLGPLEDALADAANALGPSQRRCIELAQRNALRLQKLVNTLLDFSRVEAGRIQAVYQPTALAAFTADIAASFRSACERAGLTLTIHAPPLAEPVFVDREMWEKIVLNLVSNAFKFTFEGGIDISLAGDDGQAVLRVSDTGVGIPEAELPRLFERFHRVAGTQGRTHEGTGIGLALVQELVNLHKGAIEVDSRLGQGTTFTVCLPFGTRHLPQDRIETERSQASTAVRADSFVAEALRWLPDVVDEQGIETPLTPIVGPKASILVADDNADMRDYLRQLLGQRYVVRLAANGTEALAAIRVDRPDLVLADIMMPELDGYGLLRTVRGDPTLVDLPVVLLSARAGEEATIEGLDAGADDYLIKPFSARELVARLSANLERARGRRQVRESEERFRALVTATSDVVYRMSPDWTEMRVLNGRGILADTHSPSAAWIEEYILAEDRPPMLAEIQAAINAKSVFQMEHRVRRADGTVGWVFSRAIPLLSPLGEITEWFGAASDVTERVAAVRALRQANETLERRVAEALAERRLMAELVQTTDTFVQVLDENFRILAINDANIAEYEKVYGFRPKVGDSLADLLADRPELCEPVLAVWSRALMGEAFTATAQFGDPALQQRHYEITLRPLRDGAGKIIGAYQFSTDITERREAETRLAEAEEQLRQSQKMEAVGKLTGGVAHDFNNVLQVIGGNLQLLSRDVAGNLRAEQRLQTAMAAISRGSKLASQLLAFGRRQPLAPKVINLGRLIRSIEDMLRRALGDGVEIETIISGGLWNTFVDAMQVENAILNLAINARDAMDGHGKLTIETANAFLDADYAARHGEVDQGQYVMIAVTDTGCGIPPDMIERVFEPFFTTKPEGHGTGLGLSMAYGFVRQSGGHIKIYSEPGQGTTVRIYLPRARELEDVETKIETAPATGGTETVLVVEDDEEVRGTVVDMLSELGYRVLKAKDAQSALAIVESGIPIDLLFTDVVMPGPLRSPELARKAQERLPNIAVLFTSGYTENAIVHAGRLDHGIELLSKPYSREALARKIRYILANHQQPRLEHPVSRGSQRRAMAHILVIDDDRDLCLMMEEVLRAAGYKVWAAADGVQGIKLQRKQPASLLITDIYMPNKEGIETIRDFREEFPDVPIIAMSGGGRLNTQGGLLTAKELGAAVILRKPFEMSDLLRSVAATLNRLEP
jgi:signal transduction histidine kinase/DNA-binding response OmpR family regulator